jgi:outer membrane protease
MLRSTLASLAVLIVFGTLPLQAFSFGPDLEISFDFGTEILDGFTQYELKFLWAVEDLYIVYGHSKLVYPFTVYLTGGDIQASLKGFTAGFGYWAQIYDDSSVMEDFDWLTSNEAEYLLLAYGATTPNPDIYCWQINLGYKLEFPKVWFRPFFKYMKYHSELIMTDLDQTWYVNTETGEEYDPPQQFEIEGQVLYYEQDLRLPLIGMEFGLTGLSDKLEVFTSLGASLIASVDDYDDHIVRTDSLEAWNSGSNGNALLFEIGGKLNVFSSFWLNLNLGYKDFSIDTRGKQRTYLLDDDGELVRDEHGNLIEQIASGIDTQVSGVMRNLRVTLSYIFF